MNTMLAICGLDCATCDARLATVNDDEALRKATAEKWAKEFGFPCTPEMIACTGCTEEGAKIGHCAECAMRLCAMDRSLANCGACAEYETCKKIGDFIAQVPDAKTRLDAYRAASA